MALLLPSRNLGFDFGPATFRVFFVLVFAFAVCFAGLLFAALFRFGVVCSTAPLVSVIDFVFIVGCAKMRQDRKSKLRRDLTN